MIEAAISLGLHGLIITDHDNVKGGLVGQRIARGYSGFVVIPGVEVTSEAGHILAIGVREDIPGGLPVGETIDKIHQAGGIAIASHPFSTRAKSVKDECIKADAVEVFNSCNTVEANAKAMRLASENSRPKTAGSDAHWTRTLGKAGLVCEDPVEDVLKRRAQIFGNYTSFAQLRLFQARQVLSSFAGRPIPEKS